MSRFGRTLFKGSRFIFWSLAPFLAVGGASLLLYTGELTTRRIILLAVMESAIALLLIGLYDPIRFKWATRTVTGIVFMFFCWYAFDEIIVQHKELRLSGARSEASPRNALLGLIAIGCPCLLYTLLGRFAWREEETDAEEGRDEGDIDDDGDSAGT